MDTRVRLAPWLAAAVAAGVLIVTGAVVLLGPPAVVEYEPGSPEHAAQRYLEAMLDGDYDVAHGMLAFDLQSGCRPQELALDIEGLDIGSAVFGDVDAPGDRATVEIRLTPATAEPAFMPGIPEAIDTRLVLERSAGEWRVVAASWPLYGCDGR